MTPITLPSTFGPAAASPFAPADPGAPSPFTLADRDRSALPPANIIPLPVGPEIPAELDRLEDLRARIVGTHARLCSQLQDTTHHLDEVTRRHLALSRQLLLLKNAAQALGIPLA